MATRTINSLGKTYSRINTLTGCVPHETHSNTARSGRLHLLIVTGWLFIDDDSHADESATDRDDENGCSSSHDDSGHDVSAAVCDDCQTDDYDGRSHRNHGGGIERATQTVRAHNEPGGGRYLEGRASTSDGVRRVVLREGRYLETPPPDVCVRCVSPLL